jgi:long-chain acyl-CoA synthetase
MHKPWLAHYDKGVPDHIEYPRVPLFHFLKKAAEDFPQHPCTTFRDEQITYQVMDWASDALARGLISLGLRKGDRVALMLGNIPQFVLSFFAILKAGGIVVAVNPMYKARELVYQLSDSGSRFLISLSSNTSIINQIRDETSLEKIIFTEEEDAFRLTSTGMAGYGTHDSAINANELWLEQCFMTGEDQAALPNAITPEDVAIFQYTGGTTGIPKGAIGLHRNMVANTMQFKSWLVGLEQGKETVLTAIPLYHVYGMVIAMSMGVALAANLVLIPNPRNIHDILANIEKYQTTLFPGVPNMYHSINHHPDVIAGKYNLRSIKACISGSAPLLREVKEQFESLTGGKLIEGYGLSEAPTATHCNPMSGENREGSIGLPLPDVDCRIVSLDDERKDLGTGEAGELLIKSPQVMQGYHNMPGETQLALCEGWLSTGDIARMDEDGYFYLVDRKKDVIKAGGFQVWPREVEEVLSEYPDVSEVAVAGVVKPQKGEIVRAWIVPRAGTEPSRNDIRKWCKERMVSYKVPSEIDFVSELPRSTVGKVLKRELVHQYNQKMQSS